MDKKYFETKKGSLEDKINNIASEQPTINATYKPDVKLSTEKKYFETKKGSIEELAGKLIESKLDPVNKDAVKKKFDDRKDKDIDNDGDTDSTDKYLHKRRAAISKNIKEGGPGSGKIKPISTKGATKKPTTAMQRLYISNPNEHRRRQELEFMYKRILDTMPEKERNSKEGKIQAMDLARVRSAKNSKDLKKNMKNKGTLKIADSVTQDDHGEKMNQDKKDAAMKKTDQKKDFKSLRAETKIIKLGDKGKTATGKDAGAIDVEPSAKPI